ncbi:hypothetical protein AKJ60_00530 [candidate division MSBL1 archaeon SCGC-AAA385M11]|nr:hypothetical protein AKJ60_00530 [candidate division MSBL1 archaeon SCGC-AAA385M11]
MGHVMIDNLDLYLWKDASMVLTDSGGLQEETIALNIPCLTLWENTERPVTVEIGSNRLIGKDTWLLKRELERILKGEARQGGIPELWDGKSQPAHSRGLGQRLTYTQRA